MNFLRRVHPVLANIVKISGYPLISVPCFYSRIKTKLYTDLGGLSRSSRIIK